MNLSISDSNLARLFKFNKKFVEPRHFPRLREYLTRTNPDGLENYYQALTSTLARSKADATALISELDMAPPTIRARGQYIRMDAQRLLDKINVIEH